MKGLAVLALALTCAGCPQPSAAPQPDAGVCANLARLGCPEGADPTCESRVSLAVTSEHRLTTAQRDCLAGAANKASARACSAFVACP